MTYARLAWMRDRVVGCELIYAVYSTSTGIGAASTFRLSLVQRHRLRLASQCGSTV